MKLTPIAIALVAENLKGHPFGDRPAERRVRAPPKNHRHFATKKNNFP